MSNTDEICMSKKNKDNFTRYTHSTSFPIIIKPKFNHETQAVTKFYFQECNETRIVSVKQIPKILPNFFIIQTSSILEYKTRGLNHRLKKIEI